MNFSMLDTIFVIFFIFMVIIGYVKGFVVRLYDLIAMVLVFFLSYVFAKPIASLIHVYQYNENDMIAETIGKAINQMIVFIGLLIVLFIIKKILGILIKPLLKRVTHMFHLTAFVDNALGALLSGVEAVFISYIIIVFIFIPFYKESEEMLSKSPIVSRVVDLVPNVSGQVLEMKDLMDMDMSSQSLLKASLVAYQAGLLDFQQFEKLFEENIQDKLMQGEIHLTYEQKMMLKELLQKSYQVQEIESFLKHIEVDGEQ